MPRALTHEPEERMTREDYRAWASQQPSHRFERIEGVVVAMAPEARRTIGARGRRAMPCEPRCSAQGCHARYLQTA